MAKTKSAVAKTDEKSTAMTEVKNSIVFSQEDFGAGLEGADKDSFAIPFLRILQTNSPQCEESSVDYVPGAKAGMFINSVTGQLYDGKEGLVFLHCGFQRRFIRWAPRTSGSGYLGDYSPSEADALQMKGEVVSHENRLYFINKAGETPDRKKNDQLSDTRSHYGLLLGDGRASQVLLALSSTQIKKSKQMLSILSDAKMEMEGRLVTPPTWMTKIRLQTALEQNDEGSWYGLKVQPEGFIDDASIYAAGKAFNNMVKDGAVKAATETLRNESVSSDKF